MKTVKARFHSLRGSKSVLVGVKPNEFQIGSTFVYLSREGVLKAMGKKESDFEVGANYWDQELMFEIPVGYKLVPITDEKGNPRTTDDGEILQTLAW